MRSVFVLLCVLLASASASASADALRAASVVIEPLSSSDPFRFGVGLGVGADVTAGYPANIVVLGGRGETLARFPVRVSIWSVGLALVKLQTHGQSTIFLSGFEGRRVGDLAGDYVGHKVELSVGVGLSYNRAWNPVQVEAYALGGDLGLSAFGGRTTIRVTPDASRPLPRDLTWESELN